MPHTLLQHTLGAPHYPTTACWVPLTHWPAAGAAWEVPCACCWKGFFQTQELPASCTLHCHFSLPLCCLLFGLGLRFLTDAAAGTLPGCLASQVLLTCLSASSASFSFSAAWVWMDASFACCLWIMDAAITCGGYWVPCCSDSGLTLLPALRACEPIRNGCHWDAWISCLSAARSLGLPACACCRLLPLPSALQVQVPGTLPFTSCRVL